MARFTMSASTFKSRLNDASTLSEMSQLLRKDLVKPCAAKQVGIQRKEFQVRHEGSFVWQEIMRHQDLAHRCQHVVIEHEASYAALALERSRIAEVFQQLCVRP